MEKNPDGHYSWEGGQPNIYQIISERLSQEQNPNLNCMCRQGYRVQQLLDMGNGWVGPYNPGNMCS